MIFRQLHEPISSTYTYLLGCEETRLAVLIDPVINSIERDLAEVANAGLGSLTRWIRIYTPITSPRLEGLNKPWDRRLLRLQ